MKTALDIRQLADRISNDMERKNDFIVPTKDLELEIVGEGDIALHVPGKGYFDVTEHAHNQIAERVGIPKRYYQRMLQDSPELLIDNVGHWFEEEPEKRMIRTIDHTARAFLSDRYRRIDNEQIANSVFPVLNDYNSQVVVMSSDVTDKKMYMKVLFPDIVGDVKSGDSVRAGFMISNSEIGQGSMAVEYFLYRDFCTNGCVFGKRDIFGLKRTHLGKRQGQDDRFNIISDDTRELDDKLLMSQVSDVIKSATDTNLFQRILGEMQGATQTEQLQNPIEAVETLSKDLGLNDFEKDSVIQNLLEDRDYSKWGMLNAVTKVANTTNSYDRATELEGMGSTILDLNQSQWTRLVEAEKMQVVAA